ncbi:beta-ketoacyl synthase chain length factor [Stutzerimonas xanthomarina]|uniref:beta-ketoacyl synthase chain length factor n=1 Tax=Stutzerimonas xanthomarina TaxID=271420 RepID=UPI003AA85A63
MIQFEIDQWQAWAPGLTSTDDWANWAQNPCELGSKDAQPDVSFLPAMQRRRLSRLARMVFAVATPLATGRPPMPLVYASRHGETARTFAILSDLASDEPLSPTQFSLSVHNAIIGLWSIHQQDSSEMTALAAEGDGLEHALLEAALLLGEGVPEVLVVVAEDQPPTVYTPWISDVSFPYAVALLLKPGKTWQLSLEAAEPTARQASHPHAIKLVHALLKDQPTFQNTWESRQWNWQQTY